MRKISRILVSNRSEIAIRVFRAAAELNIRTFAVYTREDKLSLHRSKADEAYEIGSSDCDGPLAPYLSIDEMLRVAREHRIDAIHPGYGFLSESPEFADACLREGIIFIGPTSNTMRTLGNKLSARALATSCGVPVMPASTPLSNDPSEIILAAEAIGYPVMIKASWGGGGRGMRPIDHRDVLVDAVMSAKREAKSAFGKDEVYLEKLVRRARHVEVQLLGDQHGNLVHLFERDCSVQRRNQKVIERAPAPYIDDVTRTMICDYAVSIGKATDYIGAGTVEFLIDAATNTPYFIEVNPRIQVEHTVTEVVTGLDIVKAQIKVAEGSRIGVTSESGIPLQSEIRVSGHAIQCRITTEDPKNNFIPDHGRITAYRNAAGFGIRVDGGTAYSGALVTRFYDPLLEKVIAWAPTPLEAIDRMRRALSEYRVRGVSTNLTFLRNIVTHSHFRSGEYTTRFIDETVELFDTRRDSDRASKLLRWIADVTINGHPDTIGRPTIHIETSAPVVPTFSPPSTEGTKQILERLGPSGFAAWMKSQSRVLLTDTTMRDAHQSLLATRVRTKDLVEIAPAYSSGLSALLSVECWGGATFDVAMRFLLEDPWERLALIRAKLPNVLTQMLLRGANGVGYKNYPDNVVRHFIANAAREGMDLFRIFDCFNWVENMRVSIDAVLQAGKLAEGAFCYTGDITDPSRSKYSLRYYVELAKELESAGCHILGIKDMSGLLKPAAARLLIGALKQETSLPIHFHTHDTSGIAGATILAAVDAGADAIDLAIDSLSGMTSQPNLGSIVAALRGTERDTSLDPVAIQRISHYWASVRKNYGAFESDQRSGVSEIYLHEMPGGQFTNLKEQARSLGLEDRWSEVAAAYRTANDAFGDIIKVTPTSKVVGDLALMMVSQNISAQQLISSDHDIAFPASVTEMLRGDLGQPTGGWPRDLQNKVLKDEKPILDRPGSLLEDISLPLARADAERICGRQLDENDFASYLMYPTVFREFDNARDTFGPISAISTPIFYYGMKVGQETTIHIEDGKLLTVALTGINKEREDGTADVFFNVNGQPRAISIPNKSASKTPARRTKAEKNNPSHIGAPMPGIVSSISVKEGQLVKRGDVLVTLEAMKMETLLRAPYDSTIETLHVTPGAFVEVSDLVIELNVAA